ncbi:MAG: diphthine--ammonia ligase [Candidatus Diapherotrites archaeon]|nr:diphthine--ammonia ligase [Candidatus Diapherotrites archaeon]
MKNEKKKLVKLLEKSVEAIPKSEIGLMFSGGVDSTLLALLMKKVKLDFKCYFAYVKMNSNPRDLGYAKEIAERYFLKLEEIGIEIKEAEENLKKTIKLIHNLSPVYLGASLPFYTACAAAKKQGAKKIVSGIGADELFAGYARFFESKNLEEDCRNAFEKMLENEALHCRAIAEHFGLELCTPFLDEKIVEFALSLPNRMKIVGGKNKFILRETAIEIGLQKKFALRKKLAAQYGSNTDKAIAKLAKTKGFKRKSVYLESLSKQKNPGNMKQHSKTRAESRLGALFSGGKDSCLALWEMKKQGFGIACLISMQTKNPDSHMFHKPDDKILELQSRAIGITLIIGNTLGEKEKELKDLKNLIGRAKKEFNLSGIVTGALFSNYQKERIEKIAEELGLKVFSPLWHKKQWDVMKELLQEKFEFVFTKIAALGLDENWLGKRITGKEIKILGELDKKMGLNIAGEGGEFESLVLDAPFFKNRIVLCETEKIMRNEFTGELKIKKAALTEKTPLT